MARAKDCNHCPLKAQCTTSKQGRTVCRSVDEACLDRVRAYQPTDAYKKALRKRQVWVEPLCAEGKDWHGMRRFRLRELWRVNCEALWVKTPLVTGFAVWSTPALFTPTPHLEGGRHPGVS